MQELLLQSHQGEDSTRMGNYEKCPHFLFPISILVGGNYNLLRNTQNINGAVWKDITVTDLQPQSVTSKYWCGKGFLFRKAVETTKPTQVRTLAWASALHTLDVERSCAGLVQGSAGRIWSRPSVPIAPSDGRYSEQSEEILRSRETESIRPGVENQDGKPRVWGKCRGRVKRGELSSVLSPLPRPPSGTSPWPEAWITRGWHASWIQLARTTKESLRVSPGEVCYFFSSCLQGGTVLDEMVLNTPLGHAAFSDADFEMSTGLLPPPAPGCGITIRLFALTLLTSLYSFHFIKYSENACLWFWLIQRITKSPIQFEGEWLRTSWKVSWAAGIVQLCPREQKSCLSTPERKQAPCHLALTPIFNSFNICILLNQCL